MFATNDGSDAFPDSSVYVTLTLNMLDANVGSGSADTLPLAPPPFDDEDDDGQMLASYDATDTSALPPAPPLGEMLTVDVDPGKLTAGRNTFVEPFPVVPVNGTSATDSFRMSVDTCTTFILDESDPLVLDSRFCANSPKILDVCDTSADAAADEFLPVEPAPDALNFSASNASDAWICAMLIFVSVTMSFDIASSFVATDNWSSSVCCNDAFTYDTNVDANTRLCDSELVDAALKLGSSRRYSAAITFATCWKATVDDDALTFVTMAIIFSIVLASVRLPFIGFTVALS
jgi:hypothetical protein